MLESGNGRSWPNLEGLDDTEIDDTVTEAYVDAVGRVGKLLDGKSEDETIGYLSLLENYFGELKEGKVSAPVASGINALTDRLSGSMVNYDFISRRAFNIYYQRMEKGEMSPILGLILSFHDPKLARDLLTVLKNQNRGVYLSHLSQGEGFFTGLPANNAPIIESMHQYAALGHQENANEHENRLVGIMRKHKDKGRYRQTVIEPLEQTSSMPGVSLQIAYTHLNQRPVDNED
jgi:hypothetical protein